MFDLKELIKIGIEDGKDKNELLEILADSYDAEESKSEVFEKVYKIIYGNHLCDKFCKKLVEQLHNSTEKGIKWTMDQTTDVARKIGISFSTNNGYTQAEFWCAMHLEYYCHSESLKESGIDDVMLFGKFADDYLDDRIAGAGKLVDYFFLIDKNKIN